MQLLARNAFLDTLRMLACVLLFAEMVSFSEANLAMMAWVRLDILSLATAAMPTVR